ncbi:MAG TPA: aminoglycoside adenylyltransferase domain-containing protein [Anaerolineales bacterium]|nr:aminoglycoside adenylyltransferase domain-containing protein [Anaerolineales bacterium]
MNANFPTSNTELNTVLYDFVKSVQEILKDNFVSAYLQGSFAIGDWDNDSDVDFTIVVEDDISDADLQALQIMHARLYNLESEWAKHLEGSYFPKNIIKSGNRANKGLWYLNNTFDKLALSNHDNTWVVRWIVREHGITLAGIPAKDLIDFVRADDLRKEILSTMREWGSEIISGQWKMDNKWAQPYVVIMYCRMLHSLNTGRINSKLSGVQWAKNNLDSRWTNLIQRAWDERPNPSLKVRQPAEIIEVKDTIEFVRFAIDLGQSCEFGK